ncbi:DUF262 domain-containing protein [Pseudomonas sp. FEMGT703P]|uniref:DUF262 domain-containing protein n=1 Tax=Pseudomonas sp. FEMGT703P TaxID=2080764 RepID=UPI00259D1D8D|nr:DUF262 domain-containing protein [Pseudomonas sp. FEMGT703P]
MQNTSNINNLSEEDIESWFESEEEQPEVKKLTDEELSQRYAETQIRIVRTSLDFTLHTLASSIKDSNYIDIAPGYQRRARWDRKKKSLLIESFLMNIPIPPLFLFEKDYNQYEIMDGRQRLEAISEFLDNKYALTGLEFWVELQGKRFSDLPGIIQRGLLRRTINAVVLLAETERDTESFDIRLILFRRLNTGGIKLNAQEMRNALYPGYFNETLHKLSRGDKFTKLWRIPQKSDSEENETPVALQKNVLYRSMMDCELVLRFFSVRDVINNKVRGSLRQVFDKTMERYSKISTTEVDILRSDFESTLERVTDALGYNFHLLPNNNQASRPLYDAILVAAFELPNIDLAINSVSINARIEQALADQENYEILVGRGNTIESIKDRVILAKKIIKG